MDRLIDSLIDLLSLLADGAQECNHLCLPLYTHSFSPLLGDGIFSADFDNWLTQRKVLVVTPYFAPFPLTYLPTYLSTYLTYIQRAANMFKITNFKHFMLEAVRTKCLKLMSILKEDIQKKGDGKTMKVDMQVGSVERSRRSFS